jgi:hypothetical protein
MLKKQRTLIEDDPDQTMEEPSDKDLKSAELQVKDKQFSDL